MQNILASVQHFTLKTWGKLVMTGQAYARLWHARVTKNMVRDPFILVTTLEHRYQDWLYPAFQHIASDCFETKCEIY